MSNFFDNTNAVFGLADNAKTDNGKENHVKAANAKTDKILAGNTVPPADKLIKIGQLKKPYGIKGWLWVYSLTDERSDIFAMSPWWIKTATGFKSLTVSDWRQQGSGIVAQFAEVPDRNVAETMHGVSIWVSSDALPEPEADEYYWSELVGLSVVNEQGENLGRIDKLMETGAHDVMVIVATADSVDNEQRLIPWHKQTVINVNKDEALVTVAWQADY